MRSFVLGAVVASWAFLESNVNELFEDASHYEPASALAAEARTGLTPELHKNLSALSRHVERIPTLEKYEIALKLSGVAPVPSGAEPGQSASLLRRVRNRVLHYRPYSVRDGVPEADDARLSNSMEGRVELPEWDRGDGALFPTRIICPGLAKWCIAAAVQFADDFSRRSGVDGVYAHVRPAWLREPETT
jgi:hypothetical protein